MPRHIEELTRWLKLAGRKARGCLVCGVDAPTHVAHGVKAVPWHLAWCEGEVSVVP